MNKILSDLIRVYGEYAYEVICDKVCGKDPWNCENCQYWDQDYAYSSRQTLPVERI